MWSIIKADFVSHWHIGISLGDKLSSGNLVSSDFTLLIVKYELVLYSPENWDVSKVPLLEFFQSEFCVCDIISSRQLTQLHGTVFILDLAGLSLAHVKACTWSTLRLLGSITNGYPMKIKGVHFLHHPSIFNAIFAMAKLTMKPKLIKRVVNKFLVCQKLAQVWLNKFHDSGQVPRE